MSLSPKLARLKDIANLIPLQDKIRRITLIQEMKEIISVSTSDDLKEVVKQIDSTVALKFLIPAGIHGEARLFLFEKVQRLEQSAK